MTRTTLLTALIACSFSAQAIAQSAPVSRHVRLSDLNLANHADRQVLDSRLAKAALAVCGAKSVGDGVGNEKIDACRGQALAQGRKDAEVRIASGASTVQLAARSE